MMLLRWAAYSSPTTRPASLCPSSDRSCSSRAAETGPAGLTAVESATLEAARTSTRGGGWAPSGLGSRTVEPHGAARRALRRRRRLNQALPRGRAF
eukprot:scaffold91117_cov63-Phaeocystis_antarctica.AAC.1